MLRRVMRRRGAGLTGLLEIRGAQRAVWVRHAFFMADRVHRNVNLWQAGA